MQRLAFSLLWFAVLLAPAVVLGHRHAAGLRCEEHCALCAAGHLLTASDPGTAPAAAVPAEVATPAVSPRECRPRLVFSGPLGRGPPAELL